MEGTDIPLFSGDVSAHLVSIREFIGRRHGFDLRSFSLPKGCIGERSDRFVVRRIRLNDGHNRIESVRAMEGIVRQARKANPKADIVFVYTTHRDAVERYLSDGKLNENMRNHEAVAAYYGIPSVNFSSQIARFWSAGAFDWDAFSADDVHPRDFGYSLYAKFLHIFLDEALSKSSLTGPWASTAGNQLIRFIYL